MKEYTYTNKAYLGIKEGVVPPAPQYLWLNSKDNKLYKFGDGGWEIINNDNLYVADFTIEDLENLSATNSSLNINARALIAALNDKKAIGVLQKEATGDDYSSMSIASAYKQGRTITLTVISGSGTIYKVSIDCGPAKDPEVEDSETGKIHGGFIQVIPIENPSFVPFSMDTLNGVVDGDREFPFRKETIMLPFLENKPLFITAAESKVFGSGFIPVSYWITKQGGDPTAVDIDIVYNNGLYHIHWDITDDITLFLNKDTVSYTPFSDVYIVTEFTVDDIVSQSLATSPKLTISRAFLDAAYRGVPIMVRVDPSEAPHVPITVHRINNPNEGTAIRFKVQQENIEYLVSCIYNRALIGDDDVLVDATITSYNLVDWNTNESHITGYIANRTHHLGNRISFELGSRFSLENTKGTHYIDNYKLLYDGKLYDLPTVSGVKVFISNYFTIIYNGYSESGNTSVYTFTTNPLSMELPSPSFEICRDLEEGGYKALDEFYLPDGAKPWKYIDAIYHPKGNYMFTDIGGADIADRDNVIRNKIIYGVEDNGGGIYIKPSAKASVIEFKIRANGIHSIDIESICVWENGEKPNVSDGDKVIYSFLVLNGMTYASAKVYRALQ